MLNNKTILITGATGSFGNAFIDRILEDFTPKKIIVFSRDEFKQYQMRKKYIQYDDIIRYFLGDIRDEKRLNRAFSGVDIVIHAAALKQVPAIEYNPIEAIQTNINGAVNIIDACINNGVKKVVALSTDKACLPINFYGMTKSISDKLFQSSNVYAENHDINISIVRYGNVAGSRGSVIPKFIEFKELGVNQLLVTHPDMTRFYITLEQAVDLVLLALKEAKGGEIFAAKMPSFKITDLVQALGCTYGITGIREGEKIHEDLINENDITYDYGDHYRLYPKYEWYNMKDKTDIFSTYNRLDRFSLNSGNNDWFLSVEDLKELVKGFENE
jgi:UDP-N-acetylglucosamine 4,6-dehydratase (inverting)